ncbi:DUF4394 domain-containing protein [Flavobacterium selenitireducens]|uniref:DUF4394 domain-containing protein n=1 Tax=Flavobacterium selenitireducens TaxID=2722704 RepID=UPI00168AC47B|nr:DUF4394 domain-containing protein [Flavobacterium selenitireducens]MBD3582880.1 DUF4394 domain-containing protein [Flavobacterium selenitireducens]
MKKILRSLFCLGAVFSAATFTSCNNDDDGGNTTNPPVQKPNLEFYGLTTSNSLVKYNANNSATAISTMPVTGLQASENLLAIDFRPGTGQLYGLGSTNQLYIINTSSGAATAVGAPFTPAVSGSMVGFDFNPTVDRIRLVTSSGQNLRLHPETGAVAATDGNLNPGSPNVGSAAYTNNMAGASFTELFVIDFSTKMLYKQDPPNDGDLTGIGNLDLTGNVSADGGFDIAPSGSVALANFTTAGMDHLYQINLTTGKATDLGMLSTSIIGIAIPTSPVAYAVDGSNNLHTFNFMSPGTPVSKAITGLQPSESVVGIDMRPVTGQLFALGSTGRLYVINTATGASTMVGAGPVATLVGTDFGFDFNPFVDKIRIVSDTGQNLRVNPVDGSLVATDGNLNPGTPTITAAAYTNSYPGTASTVLYDIDSATDMLYKQDPPNAGTLTAIGSLGIDVMDTNGFDIGGNSNTAYAILTVGTTNKIYSINLSNGSATAIADFPASVNGFAVGLGF